ncbi:MAG: helix-turn-helix domain-containing protein [Coriobacteriia bacterium]
MYFESSTYILSVPEAADLLGMNESDFNRVVDSGEIEPFGRDNFALADLEAYARRPVHDGYYDDLDLESEVDHG